MEKRRVNFDHNIAQNKSPRMSVADRMCFEAERQIAPHQGHVWGQGELPQLQLVPCP